MLTLFSIPKAFTGRSKTIQHNAIRSWTKLSPPCEIILLGKDEGTAETAAELGLRHIPEVQCNEYGTPLVSSMFAMAQQAATHPVLCYVNADIILLSDFLPAVQRITAASFLMVGQRWDINLEESIDFNRVDWEQNLRKRLELQGKLHPPAGIDYFIFSRGLYTDIPPFALGRTAWDNWLVYRARSLKTLVIDATRVVTAIHQNHDYAHMEAGEAGAFKGPEARRNQELLGKPDNSFGINNLSWMLTPRGLKRAMTLKRLYYQFDAIPALNPRLGFLSIPKKVVFTLARALRSILGISRK